MSDEQAERQSGGENPGVEEDVARQGDEGRRAAQAAPSVGQDAEPGKTAEPAAADDVGVPSDEELSDEEA